MIHYRFEDKVISAATNLNYHDISGRESESHQYLACAHASGHLTLSDFLSLTKAPEEIGGFGFYQELHTGSQPYLSPETTHIVSLHPGMTKFSGQNLCLITPQNAFAMTFLDD